jgi:hypothetical protein
VYMDWIYSQKHDGLRVRVDGVFAWTRGGMKIDLSSIWTPPEGTNDVFDAELCMHTGPGGHDAVLRHVLAGKTQTLIVRIFDLFDTTGLLTTGQRLYRLWGLSIHKDNLVRYAMVHTRKGPSFHQRLATMDIGSQACEGVVVRNTQSVYDSSGSRNNHSIFKVKHVQWSRLQTFAPALWI